jgi:non-specific serine/threonine protein kinase
LIGREHDVEAAVAAIRQDGARLLTLTGPGGIGKTRLAVAIAEQLADDFPDGIWFVDLAPVRESDLVATAIAGILGVRVAGTRPIVTGLQTFLRERRALLLLDNVEHVLDAAPLATELLAACSKLVVLATSRAPLRLTGERVVTMSPLALAVLPLPPLVELAEVPAIHLYVERARTVQDGFALTEDNATSVVQICRRLDGLPLAIELAAARSRVLSPATLLARLDRPESTRLSLLTGGPRDAPARLQTMRDAIAWSYDLLTEDERRLFRRLAVFVGGFALEAAEVVAGEQTAPHLVLNLVESLVEKSLLQPLPRPAGASDAAPARFGMLETIREYAMDQLGASGEVDAVRRRHAAYLLTLAEVAEPLLRGPDQVAWLKRLEGEMPNIQAALAWLRDAGDAEHAGNAEAGLRLVAALWTFWVVRDHVPEGSDWAETFLALAPAESAGRLKALLAQGDLSERQGEYATATARTEEALALARLLGDRSAEAAALRGLGNVAMARGEVALHGQGDAVLANAEFAWAQTCLEQSAAIARELGDAWSAAKATHWLAIAVDSCGDHAVGIRYFEDAIATFRRLGDRRQLCLVLWNLGGSTHRLGDLPQARLAFGESLTLAHQLGYRWHSGLCLVGLALVALDSGEAARAAWLLGAAAALREATGEPFRPVVQAHHDQVAMSARVALGETGFAAAWASGIASPPDTAIAEALAKDAPAGLSPAPPAAPAPHDALTPREREVLGLLAEGKSDREIGAALFVSRRTAATHVAGIYRKLSVTSRAAAAAYAVRHGLA